MRIRRSEVLRDHLEALPKPHRLLAKHGAVEALDQRSVSLHDVKLGVRNDREFAQAHRAQASRHRVELGQPVRVVRCERAGESVHSVHGAVSSPYQ